MTTVLLIIHLIVAVALVSVVLMQRSEGGALGIGGGPGGMVSGSGAANLLTRTTMLLAAVFIGNSILLAIVSQATGGERSVVEDRGAPESAADLFGEGFAGPDEDAPEPLEAETPPADAPEPDVPPADAPASEPDAPQVPNR